MKSMPSYEIDENLFGNVFDNVHDVDFQKRGLGHAHFISFLDKN